MRLQSPAPDAHARSRFGGSPSGRRRRREPRWAAVGDAASRRIDVREVGGRGREPFGRLVLARFQLAQPTHHASDMAAVPDDGDHGGDLPLEPAIADPFPDPRHQPLVRDAVEVARWGVSPNPGDTDRVPSTCATRLSARRQRMTARGQPGFE